MRTDGLTPKQQRFVAEYLVDLNATQAAVRAGYSAHTAQVQSSRLLSNAIVRAAVENGNRAVLATVEITAERVLKEYARIAFADMRHFASVNKDGIDLKDSDEWSDDDAAAVAELGETTTKEGGSVRFKLHSKVAALDSLAKHLGLLGNSDAPPVDARSLTIIGSLDEPTLRALAGLSGNG